METMRHSEGVKALEVSLAYVEQQGEAAATGTMSSRYWRNLAVRRRKLGSKLQSLISLNNRCVLHFARRNKISTEIAIYLSLPLISRLSDIFSNLTTV